MLNSKLILTDVDGVLLHWEWMFDIWMNKHGYTKNIHNAYSIAESYKLSEAEGERLCTMFNETVYIRNLPPYRDAIRYTRKLHEDHGYVFHAITSISNDPLVIESRVENLYRVFGRSMFFDITCLHPTVSKAEILKQYKYSNCFWVEDHLENAAIGTDLGLQTLLMNQTYNHTTSLNSGRHKYIMRVNNWKQIYERVVS